MSNQYTTEQQDNRRYERQMSLQEIGIQGQTRLAAAKVLVVGAGGLGCPVLQYLASSGVGTLGIIDGDTVTLNNLHRQILYGDSDIGQLKVECAVKRLRSINPTLNYMSLPYGFDSNNALTLVRDFDLVIDASDNFETRYLVNDSCVLTGKPFVAASILGFCAQLSVYNLTQNNNPGPTFRCLFPDPPARGSSPNCAEGGVLGPVVGSIGCLQALEAIKVIIGSPEVLSGKLLTMNLLSGETKCITFARDEMQVKRVLENGKPLMGSARCETRQVSNKGDVMSAQVKTISVKELHQKREAGEDFQLIDVREPNEYQISSLGGELIPLQTLPDNVDKISRTKPVVIHCRSGGRSERTCEYLMQQGFENVMNLTGGITAWAREIAPGMKVG